MTETETNWSAYYRHTAGREPRPLFQRGIAALDAAGATPGDAIEIGFGDGTETLELLARGWHVTAIDPTPEAAAGLREKASGNLSEGLSIVTAAAQGADLSPFDLLYAGYALSFIPPEVFAAFWERVRAALGPGGWLVFNVFGVKDTWASDPLMTFLDRAQAEALVAGLEVVVFDEQDEDGNSFVGPKHWHLFDVVARAPR
ncbi:MAG: class I SAM-dependent methyltransferase [Chloroflexi bacterium]|nr:class I SAM-dependent methyltransferase [Chloroflexota bacterium]